jgi:hypothetical protein
MGILVDSGRLKMSELLLNEEIHVAWGNGDPAWDASPVAEPVTATALIAEVGRRIATQVAYVTPDAGGAIIVDTGTFTISGSPTAFLYVRANFDLTDSVGEDIRESGMFVSGTIDPGVPGGQTYFLPADVLTPGSLMTLKRFTKFTRTSSVKQTLEFVLEV